jgi:hypothetical protein
MGSMRRRSGPILALGFATVLALAACGSDNSSSSSVSTVTTVATTTATTTTVTTTTASTTSGQASAQLCQARDALQTSVKDLGNVDVVKNGTAGVKDALTKVKDNLAAVKAAAGDQLQPQVTAFQDALTQLDTAVGQSSGGGIVTGLKNVSTTGATLLSALSSLKCSS